MIEIHNDGPAISGTNYWDTEHAGAGYFYLSWNAGAARLLVPDTRVGEIAEMRTGEYVILSYGPWTDQGGRPAWELLWEDGSDAPYALHLVEEQTDRRPPEADQGGGLIVTAWTRGGLAATWPGKYRRVREIPCLRPWSEH